MSVQFDPKGLAAELLDMSDPSQVELVSHCETRMAHVGPESLLNQAYLEFAIQNGAMGGSLGFTLLSAGLCQDADGRSRYATLQSLKDALDSLVSKGVVRVVDGKIWAVGACIHRIYSLISEGRTGSEHFKEIAAYLHSLGVRLLYGPDGQHYFMSSES